MESNTPTEWLIWIQMGPDVYHILDSANLISLNSTFHAEMIGERDAVGPELFLKCRLYSVLDCFIH